MDLNHLGSEVKSNALGNFLLTEIKRGWALPETLKGMCNTWHSLELTA